MQTQYKAHVLTDKEYLKCHITQTPFSNPYPNNYVMVEPIRETPVLRAKILFRHPSLYSLNLGRWEYLDENDRRSYSPIIEYMEKGRPFYLTFGEHFYKVSDIRTNNESLLEFLLAPVIGSSLN